MTSDVLTLDVIRRARDLVAKKEVPVPTNIFILSNWQARLGMECGVVPAQLDPDSGDQQQIGGRTYLVFQRSAPA